MVAYAPLDAEGRLHLSAEQRAALGDAERVRKFAVLPSEFSIEEGELTSSLKLRRKVIHERHADEIERLFAGRV